jgi:hypothetical protein
MPYIVADPEKRFYLDRIRGSIGKSPAVKILLAKQYFFSVRLFEECRRNDRCITPCRS